MPKVNTKFNNGVFEIELNSPENFNALNKEILTALERAVIEARLNSDVRSVLLYGNGKAFCSGGDLKDFGTNVNDPIEAHDFIRNAHRSILEIYNIEKPVIAAVHGFAVGAGCNLALACDLVISDESATFSELFCEIGAMPDAGGLYFLAQRVGMHIASDLILTGKKLSGREAMKLGLINEVVEEGKSYEKGLEIARKLAEGPTKAFGIAKRIMHQAPYLSFEDFLQLEAYGQSIVFQTKDFKEGRSAFIEKRKPKFLGR